MIFAILNGSRIDGFINCSSQDAPVGAVDASDLSDWQRANNSYVTWNGTGWIVDPNLPSPPTPPTPLQALKRIWNFLGDIITQDASAIALTGGTITGVTISGATINNDVTGNLDGNITGTALSIRNTVPINKGGTGATDYSAAQTNLGFVQAYNATDLPITNTTATNANGLSLSLGANEKWAFELTLGLGSNTTAGLKLGLSFPAGATLNASVRGNTTSAVITAGEKFGASGALTATAWNALVSQAGHAHISGMIVNGATPGTLQLQAAKVTSGTATILALSHLKATKI